MKNHSDKSLESSKAIAFDRPPSSNAPAKPRVRYIGFESIEGWRRLRFSVKSIGHDPEEITIEITNATFTGVKGISIQDAAPMAFEKIVELLTTRGTLESKELRLTDADIEQYLARHVSSQKRASEMFNRRRSDVAA